MSSTPGISASASHHLSKSGSCRKKEQEAIILDWKAINSEQDVEEAITSLVPFNKERHVCLCTHRCNLPAHNASQQKLILSLWKKYNKLLCTTNFDCFGGYKWNIKIAVPRVDGGDLNENLSEVVTGSEGLGIFALTWVDVDTLLYIFKARGLLSNDELCETMKNSCRQYEFQKHAACYCLRFYEKRDNL